MKRLFTLTLLLLAALTAARGQALIEITLTEAGSLSSLVSTTKKDMITNLKIRGDINAADLYFINEMARLERLDLSDAHIIASSGYYNGKTQTFIKDTELNTLPYDCFYSHDNYRSIILPRSLVNIAGNAFAFCENLESVTLGPDFRYNGEREFRFLFGYTPALQTIEVDAGNSQYQDISGVLFSRDGKTLVYYPEQHAQTTYVIPDSVTTLAPQAFYATGVGGGNLRTLVIPASVTDYPDELMASTPNLSRIYVEATEPPLIGDKTFNLGSQLKQTCVLCVPQGCYSKYWLAKGWGDFAQIVEETYTALSPAPTAPNAVSVEGRTLIISPAGGQNINIFDAGGRKLYGGPAASLSLPHGTYLIRTGGQTIKINL